MQNVGSWIQLLKVNVSWERFFHLEIIISVVNGSSKISGAEYNPWKLILIG